MSSIPVHILGFSYNIPVPYGAGHICSAAEASALNKLLVRGTSKGLHKILSGELSEAKRRGTTLDADTRNYIAASGEDYITEFREGFAQGHEKVRAVRVEASRLARQLLEAQLNRQGKRSDELTSHELAEALGDLANSEKVRNEAERRVRVTQEIASRAHDELLGGEGE